MTPVLACRSCGTQPLENARFCHGCGAPVAAAGAHAEYKQVTVLFADVVHSMDIAAALGAERLREIMTELVNRAAVVVQRYGGTVDKFTGDGIMAVFGAPAALEDHALRACLAALGVQDEAKRLAGEVDRRDGVVLQLRVGLNSGQVVAGEIGTGALGYTAVGEQVGLAQRMEAVAAPETVMLGESTARLVEGAAVLGEPQLVHIKGVEAAVPAWQLLGVVDQYWQSGPAPATLVGREWELYTLTTMLDRSFAGRGSVVTLVGRAGIGKTRLAREAARVAKNLGVTVFSTFCESHATDIPFRAVTRLLRAAAQVSRLDDATARVRVRSIVSDGDPQDLLLLYDLLGIADPRVELPKIAPEARRRRLAALINAVQLARAQPAVYVIEDAHWMDEASESMVAEFLTVIPQTHSMVMVTYRPDYRGALRGVRGAQSIALGPLSDAETSALIAELLGPDPSVAQIAEIIATRAAGNPFFAEEIIRELAERRVLVGGVWPLRVHRRGRRRDRAGHAAGNHRRAHRPAQPGSQADPQCRGRHRISLQHRAADRPGHRPAYRGADQRGTRRPGAVHGAGRIRVPASADSHRGLRVAIEISSRPDAPAARRGDRSPGSGIGGPVRRADRRTPRGRR
ncbi:hypothetical protein MSHO_09880 [Mycobacterium shottsii]|uniref:Guanylate cyclase domain-containing protein n=1 Tax=Mycobacterium shottsii TaxID=133549 RepID=A0A7I7L8T0_9MYCO|nr:hypothetical protein MSHO_09880 [Mycobacterium shottsii]